MGSEMCIRDRNISELSDDSKYRVLAQFSNERMPQEPELPTAKEQGVDLVMTSERGIAAPAKVPDDIEKRMADAVKAVLEDPAFLEKAKDLSLPIAYLSGDDWQKGLDEQKTRYQALWDKSPWVK